MKDCFGQHGWKEFHRNRKNILDEYQRLIDLTANRPIKVAHGTGVEAYIRKWLSEFLPKKYGVTSGYVIPNLYDDSLPIYHFDIIIYNRLEAPILWTEGNEDNSEQGKYRAIPAKHVVSIYEVKSRLTNDNAKDAIDKLSQVDNFKDQLPKNYSSGIIFVELKKPDNQSKKILKTLHLGKNTFGFTGGLIIQYEEDESLTGRITLSQINKENTHENKALSPLAKTIAELNIYQREDGSFSLSEKGSGLILVKTKNNEILLSKLYAISYSDDGFSTLMSWSRSNFSQFCVDLLSHLDGTFFSDEKQPLFGMIFDSFEQKKAPPQPSVPRQNHPFLIASLHNGGPNGERHLIDIKDNTASITFWLGVENEGDTEAVIFDKTLGDSFVLPSKKKIAIPLSIQVRPTENDPTIMELLNVEGLKVPHRFVYRAGPEGKELFSLEKIISIKSDDISISTVPAQPG